jgi:hypothetical protein
VADTRKTGGRGRRMLKAAVQAGGLVVASGLISGAAHAKDADKKIAAKGKDPASNMAVKYAPNSASKSEPGSAMAFKLAPNSAANKSAPGSTMAIKQAPNSKALKKAEKVNPPKGP